MRRILSSAVVFGLLVLPASSATGAESGRIEGVVVRAGTEEAVAGVEVTLTIGTRDATSDPKTRTETTDDRGRYSFDDLATGEDVVYALDAVHDGALFPGGAFTLPADTTEPPVLDTTLRVWPTTTDPSAIVVSRDSMFVVVDREEGGVGVIESVDLTNIAQEAYAGRGADDEGADPRATATLGFALPAEARASEISIIEADIDVPVLLRTDYGFAITAAIPPGRHSFTFSYGVNGTAGSYDLSKRVLYPTLEYAILAEDGLEVTSDRLAENGDVELNDKTYREFSTDETLEASDPVQAMALADAGTPAGLVLGMVGALVLVGLLGIVPLAFRRRGRATEGADDEPEPEDERDVLLRKIAALDLRHENGEVGDDDWREERAALKERIVQLSSQERVPR